MTMSQFIKTHHAKTRANVQYRWGCIILKPTEEEVPFEPPETTVVAVYANTRDEVFETIADEYPTSIICFVDKMTAWQNHEELLNAWEVWRDEKDSN